MITEVDIMGLWYAVVCCENWHHGVGADGGCRLDSKEGDLCRVLYLYGGWYGWEKEIQIPDGPVV